MQKNTLDSLKIRENASILEADWIYRRTKIKMVIVIDDNDKFKGIITHREINRCDINPYDKVSSIVNTNCKFVEYNEDKDTLLNQLEYIFNTFKNIQYIPIIKENYVVDLFSREKLPDKNENNKIIIINENGEKRNLALTEKIPGLNLMFGGSNNTLILHEPFNFWDSTINFKCDNNSITFEKNTIGEYHFTLNYNPNIIEIGANIISYGFWVTLHGDILKIGDNCLFSNSITLWTDGHSIIDAETKELLNHPELSNHQGHEIVIGNQVYICENVTLLKRTRIPDNCVVGHSSVVTKPFTESFCLYAGNPAIKRKEGISWVSTPPCMYDKNKENFEINNAYLFNKLLPSVRF